MKTMTRRLFQNEGKFPLVLPYIRGHFGNSEMTSKAVSGSDSGCGKREDC